MTFSQALLSVASRWPAQPVSSDPSSQSCPCGDVPPVECPSASSTWNQLDADFGRSKWCFFFKKSYRNNKYVQWCSMWKDRNNRFSEETWGEVSRLLNTLPCPTRSLTCGSSWFLNPTSESPKCFGLNMIVHKYTRDKPSFQFCPSGSVQNPEPRSITHPWQNRIPSTWVMIISN